MYLQELEFTKTLVLDIHNIQILYIFFDVRCRIQISYNWILTMDLRGFQFWQNHEQFDKICEILNIRAVLN